MANVTYNDLLNNGVHFGHLKRKWNPKMAPYIFMERNGIHILDLNKTLSCLDTACQALQEHTRRGRQVMFVATKKQAKDIVAEHARALRMPYVTERWLGGMLTNFATVRKSIKKMKSIERMMKSEQYKNLAKRERLMLSREKDKMERILGGIADMNRPPAALFVVDVKREHIAVKEARRLGIPVFGIVDTNSDPSTVDFPIPANDDAFKSVALLMKVVSEFVESGLQMRKQDRDEAKREKEEAQKRAMDEGKEAPAAPVAEETQEAAPEATAEEKKADNE